jgi:hypothetical protein
MNNPSWWLENWTCQLCRVTIRKHHKSRHLQSKGHRGREALPEDFLESDLAFARFLTGIDVREFRGEELKLYRSARRARGLLAR